MAVKTQAITELIPDVLDEVPGATDVEISLALRSTIRRFLDKTEMWQEELPDLDVIADQRTYMPTIPYDVNIKRILWMRVKTATTDDFDDLTDYPEDYYDLIEDNQIYFLKDDYAPDTAVTDGIRIKAVLVPLMDSLDIPERIYNDWGDVFVAGAKAQLCRSPNKPYTNPKIEADNRFAYNDGVTRALAEKARRNKNATPGFTA